MAQIIKHWRVIIDPPQYDDDDDNGYAWSGPAANYDEAVANACAACSIDNTDDDDDDDDEACEPGGYWYIDPEDVQVIDCELDQAHHARQLLAAIKAYDERKLNGPEIAPTGDDYNALHALVMAWLGDDADRAS